MMDVAFLMIAIVFVLAGFVFGIATLSQSPTVRSAAYKAVFGSVIAALISMALAAWFFPWPY